MKILIMAGGRGSRLSDPAVKLPKVLREINGKPLLSYVLDLCIPYGHDNVTIVAGFMSDMVTERFPDYNFAIQSPQLGTGHAVMCGLSASSLLDYNGNLLILSGDTPLIQPKTLQNMLTLHNENDADCTILTCPSDKKLALGRILRENSRFCGIVEDKDATEEQKNSIFEYNAAVYIFKTPLLRDALRKIKNNNNQKEYYLTDTLSVMLEDNRNIVTAETTFEYEIMGVNTPDDLRIITNIISQNNKPFPENFIVLGFRKNISSSRKTETRYHLTLRTKSIYPNIFQ